MSLMWSYEYDPQGGLDCMSAGITIDLCGRTLLPIDLRDFGQRSYTNPEPHMVADATALAQRVVAALNAGEPA